MKTSTSEVRCDGCGQVIPVMHPTAIFATLRGPTIGHKKLDCCNVRCLENWASRSDEVHFGERLADTPEIP